ncbi:hypothetical protein ESOMN_v1c02780 [Williamsoniiplasma somnilux]|uniref:Uncharacterized protein n=1 Tax=Williamsoniiplasma somnilux TaxID=215578 RepID=A0A2K8NXW5_9MOLU|nr:hypothetical protein [Williamsoniiplasma somnilux]ATZ18660.1 hypothetical protein ESOMN_v1c02780 [Williamsoniiplasma somnilux]
MKKENIKLRSELKCVLILIILLTIILRIFFVVFQLSQRRKKNISKIKNDFQNILNNKFNFKWDVNELQKKVNNNWESIKITVKLIFTNNEEKTKDSVNNYMSILERQIDNGIY